MESRTVCTETLGIHLYHGHCEVFLQPPNRGRLCGFLPSKVFDGHDGADAALYAKEHLLSLLLQDPLFSTSVEKAVKKVFLRLDRDFKEACQRDSSLDSGTTALIGLLQSRYLSFGEVV